MKHNTTLVLYIRHRITKLLVPFWISVTFVTIMYAFTAPAITNSSIIESARLGEYFAAIGQGEYSWYDYLMSCVGLRSVSAANWFVLVILVSYLLFLLLKECIGIDRRLKFVIVYTVGLVAFAAFTMSLQWPAHYWRNLWALVVGIVLALYEKEFLQRKTCMLVVIGFVVNVYLIVYSRVMHDVDIFYIFFANASLLFIALCSYLMTKFELRSGFNIIIKLSSLSYMIYLLHGPLLNEQWLVFGYHNSLLMILAATIIIALPLTAMSNKTQRWISK